MTEKEYQNLLDLFSPESDKDETPEEARQIFVDIGMLDEHGNACKGYEDLVAYLDYITSRPEFDPK
jgi:hypothetical protein